MSGCRDQLSYNKAKEHVENCNYKYYISDDKILLTNCDSSKNINLPFIDTLFISNYINKYSFNKVQDKFETLSNNNLTKNQLNNLNKKINQKEKYLCIFCKKVPKNLFLTECCSRCICSYCGYTNKNNQHCLCPSGLVAKEKTIAWEILNKNKLNLNNSEEFNLSKIRTFTIINPVDYNLDEFNDLNIFKCCYSNCTTFGTYHEINKHIKECCEGYAINKFHIYEPNEYYNYEYSSCKEIPSYNYLNDDYYSYSNNNSFNSSLNVSNNFSDNSTTINSNVNLNNNKFNDYLTVRSILKLSYDLIAIGANLGEIDCWNENKDSRVWSTKEHTSFIYSMINIDENHFASGELSDLGLAIIWEYSTQSCNINKKVNLENNGIWVLCFINADFIASGMDNNSILIWDLKCKSISKQNTTNDNIAIKQNNNSNSSTNNKTSDYIRHKIYIHTGYVKTLMYIKSFEYLISGGADSKIITTKISSSGFSLTEYFNKEHNGIIMSLCNFKDVYIASGDDLGVIKIWSFNSKNSIKTLYMHSNAVTRIVYFNPSIMITSSLDKCINYISVEDDLNFSVIKSIKTKESVWDMIYTNPYKSFTVMSFNSSKITTYSNN